MKKEDDYVSGPHDYWIHFWCGLFVGAGFGGWVGFRCFGDWRMWLVSLGFAISFALVSGRCGDKFWTALIKRWSE